MVPLRPIESGSSLHDCLTLQNPCRKLQKMPKANLKEEPLCSFAMSASSRTADPYEDWDLDLDLDYGRGPTILSGCRRPGSGISHLGLTLQGAQQFDEEEWIRQWQEARYEDRLPRPTSLCCR